MVGIQQSSVFLQPHAGYQAMLGIAGTSIGPNDDEDTAKSVSAQVRSGAAEEEEWSAKSVTPLERRLTVEHMNQGVHEAEYAVRGAVVVKAAEVAARLADPEQAEHMPFKRLIACNIGNPHAVHQEPITFFRQVAAAVTYPALLDLDPPVFPADVCRRATEYIKAMPGNSAGSYTESEGLLVVRQQIASYIERRDGFPADPEMIELTTGASEAVKRCIQVIFESPHDGVMVPCPQYPLYSCAITMFGGHVRYYYPEETTGWSVDINEVRRSFDQATADNVEVRSIVVINPGNPCGSVLPLHTIRDILAFAAAEGLVVFADEVYQDNVYTEGCEFHSFKKALRMLQHEHKGEPGHPIHKAQLISFHSTSKGILGECGQRGGYMELIGFGPSMMAEFAKMGASGLSSNTLGQIFCGVMACPPEPGDESYELYHKERSAIFEGMKRRARLLTAALNDIPGMLCQPIDGAMYAFPKIELSDRACAAAEQQDMQPDEFYCMELLEATGIICVPGSGFGQKPGTWHLRMTILPPDDMMEDVINRIREFHLQFTQTYA
jgi:alanine transaminase